jgi:hypothetical protein
VVQPIERCLGEAGMNDTTVTKVSSAHSPRGEGGEVYLASGAIKHGALNGERPHHR